jgi:NAD(P)H-flavin reductase
MKTLASTDATSPLPPWQYTRARIAAITRDAPGVQTYALAIAEPERDCLLASQPGQFNMIYLPGIGEAAISIASAPGEHPILHTVRAVGNVTKHLAGMTVDDELLLRGPYGNPWPLQELTGADLIIAAGGVGLASVRAAICQAASHRQQFGRVAVLFGAKTPADLFYQTDCEAWQAAGIDVECIVDQPCDGWNGPTGFVHHLLANQSITAATAIITCGPEAMMHALATAAFARGLPPDRFWLSMERNMHCAAGFCGLCQFGPEFVCKDGPVFRHDQIARFLEVPQL